MKLKEIIPYFREREYADTDEVEKEAEGIWGKTGYTSAKHVEESR